MTDDNILIDEAAFCALASLKPSTVRKQRMNGSGPPFVKVGRSVRYRRKDVLDCIASRTVRPTTEGSQLVRTHGVRHA